jgi:hypothetical protein
LPSSFNSPSEPFPAGVLGRCFVLRLGPVRIEDRGPNQAQQRFVLGILRAAEERGEFYIGDVTARRNVRLVPDPPQIENIPATGESTVLALATGPKLGDVGSQIWSRCELSHTCRVNEVIFEYRDKKLIFTNAARETSNASNFRKGSVMRR